MRWPEPTGGTPSKHQAPTQARIDVGNSFLPAFDPLRLAWAIARNTPSSGATLAPLLRLLQAALTENRRTERGVPVTDLLMLPSALLNRFHRGSPPPPLRGMPDPGPELRALQCHVFAFVTAHDAGLINVSAAARGRARPHPALAETNGRQSAWPAAPVVPMVGSRRGRWLAFDLYPALLAADHQRISAQARRAVYAVVGQQHRSGSLLDGLGIRINRPSAFSAFVGRWDRIRAR